MLACILAALLLTGCRSAVPAPSLHRFRFTHSAMGTQFSITLYAPDQAAAEAAAGAAFRRVDALEDVTSDYQADSELMLLCDQLPGKPVPVSAELSDVLQRAQRISKLTDGAFDVTMGPYVRLWRFARKRKVLPTPAQVAEAGASVGYQKLRLDRRKRNVTLLVPKMRLDLGGIAKGYAADQALLVLKGRGLDRALVAASGDIAIGNPPPGRRGWKIGITGIDVHTNDITRSVLLRNAGISTSGDTEQFIEIEGVRYSHILSPLTGLGLTNRIQATVIARDAATSDPLATALCILGPERALALADSLPETAALILTVKGGQKRTLPSYRFKALP